MAPTAVPGQMSQGQREEGGCGPIPQGQEHLQRNGKTIMKGRESQQSMQKEQWGSKTPWRDMDGYIL